MYLSDVIFENPWEQGRSNGPDDNSCWHYNGTEKTPKLLKWVPNHDKDSNEESTYQSDQEHNQDSEHKEGETENQDELLSGRMVHFKMIMRGFSKPLSSNLLKVLFWEVINSLASMVLMVLLWSEKESEFLLGFGFIGSFYSFLTFRSFLIWIGFDIVFAHFSFLWQLMCKFLII